MNCFKFGTFTKFIIILFILGSTPNLIQSQCLNTITVQNDAELLSALSSAAPGDCIVIEDGRYLGFTVTQSGTEENPITIRSANLGGAYIFAGIVTLEGVSYVTVEGLKILTPGQSVYLAGRNWTAGVAFKDCEYCRVTQCTFQMANAPSGGKWCILGGCSNYNRIDHCEFGPLERSVNNVFIYPVANQNIPGYANPNADRTDWAEGNGPYNPDMARYTQIDHNYFHDKAPNSAEVIVLGGAGVAGDYQDAYSVVEHNLFVNCDGDAEIIAIKASSNTIRYNTFRSCVGMISSRAGNKNAIHHNFMFQFGKEGAGGIKIYEKDHLVYNNYIDNASEYPILIGGGDPYDGDFSHAQVFRAKIVNNTIVNLNNRPVIIGHGHPLPPRGCYFANNIITGSATLIDQRLVPVAMVYQGNIVFPTGNNSIGMAASELSFWKVDPQLVKEDEIYHLSETSPAIDAAKGRYDFVMDDMDAQPRDSLPDIGADEYTNDEILNRPLLPEDVGPNASAPEKSQKVKLYHVYPNPPQPTTTIKYDLSEGADVRLTVYNLLGQKVADLVDEYQSANVYEFKWDVHAANSNLASGVYFVRLQAGSQVKTVKLILLK